MFEVQVEENKLSRLGTSISETMSVEKSEEINHEPESPILQLAVV